ncbi:Putative secreted protein, partial [Gryllus bimaculatus]
RGWGGAERGGEDGGGRGRGTRGAENPTHSVRRHRPATARRPPVVLASESSQTKMGAGKGGAEAFNVIFWFVVLILISWWIASLCFVPYLIVSVLVPCIKDLKGLQDILLAGITFPHKCSDNLVNRRSYNAI